MWLCGYEGREQALWLGCGWEIWCGWVLEASIRPHHRNELSNGDYHVFDNLLGCNFY